MKCCQSIPLRGWFKDKYSRLVDAFILDVRMMKDPEQIVLVIQPKIGPPIFAVVDCDPEGNGPGFLRIMG